MKKKPTGRGLIARYVGKTGFCKAISTGPGPAGHASELPANGLREVELAEDSAGLETFGKLHFTSLIPGIPKR